MKLQKTTIILVILALGLTGLVYFYEFRNQKIEETIQETKQKIFTFKEEDIQTIDIKIKDKDLKFEATGKEDNNPWEMKAPQIAPASNAAMSYLINLLVNGKPERTFTINPSDLSDYGVEKPFATVTITLQNKQKHQLLLGKSDFEDKLIYALVDPDISQEKEIQVSLLPKEFQYAVDRELNEWKEP